MEAIILAGGFGTRLQHVLPNIPKPMAPIRGRPFLEIALADLAKKGISRVVLSLGYMAETIIEHFGDEFASMTLNYAIEDKPLGTGGGVRLAIESCSDDHIYIFNGDTFLDLEIRAVEEHWNSNNHPIIIGRQVPDTYRYGRLITNAAHVTGFSEKGIAGPGLINAGCYVLSRNSLNEFPLNTAFSLEVDYLAKAVKSSKFDLFLTNGYFIDIGIPEDYERAKTDLSTFLP